LVLTSQPVTDSTNLEPQIGVSKMKVKLNVEAVEQLESIMEKMNYKSHQHALQVMLSTITNNLKKNAKTAENNAT
jgi:hypothetical protein